MDQRNGRKWTKETVENGPKETVENGPKKRSKMDKTKRSIFWCFPREGTCIGGSTSSCPTRHLVESPSFSASEFMMFSTEVMIFRHQIAHFQARRPINPLVRFDGTCFGFINFNANIIISMQKSSFLVKYSSFLWLKIAPPRRTARRNGARSAAEPDSHTWRQAPIIITAPSFKTVCKLIDRYI